MLRQIAIFAENTKGAMQKVTQVLDDAEVNIISLVTNDSAEYGYIYEIASENGEPRYVYFQTDAEFGRILWSYLCTPYEVDYDKPLFEDKAYR